MIEFVYLLEPFSNLDKNDLGKILSIDGHKLTVQFLRLNQKVVLNANLLAKVNLRKVGDEYDRKICDRCFKCLSVERFENNRLKKNNMMTKRPSCRDCRKIIEGEKIPTQLKKIWEAKRPKDELFDCPICEKVTIAGLSKIVIDHNHKTGNVRGFLCESCNTGLGRFKDDVKILRNAIKWLEKEH